MSAVCGVIMPMSWMVATHRWIGLSEMPTDPVVEYLARSLSSFHVFLGALCLVLASDMERYLPLIRRLGVGFFIMGLVFTGICLTSGMPWWWSALEGPHEVLVGAGILYLTRATKHEESAPEQMGRRSIL